jgi:TRAP-type C4-dicarboxylate transport system substrate-binding protein
VITIIDEEATMQRRSFMPSVLGLTAASVVLTGCGSTDNRTDSTEAGATTVVTLRLAHIDGGATLDPAVDWFTARVDELSEGQLKVEVQRSCCGGDEEKLVESVAAGEYDLGWVGTRVFGDLGVPAFQALTAPLLLDSYAVQEAVLRSDIPAEMLDDHDSLGVTGIAVLPGALRKPISADQPLVNPADWAGKTVHVFHSAANADAISALGATPTAVGFEARDQGVFDGTIQGLENSLAFHAEGRQQLTPYVAVNVNLWPRISALVANPDALSGLDDSHIEWLRQAAADVVDRTPELAETDAGLIDEGCAGGGRYAEATPADLAALSDALAPAYDKLEADPATKAFIDQIRELKQTVVAEKPVVIPAGCTGQAPAAEAPGTDDTSVLNGVYRGPEWTHEELVALGAPEQDAQNAAGTFTFTFQDGRFELRHDHASGAVFGCDGEYTVSDDQVVVNLEPGGDCGPGGEFLRATFELSADNLRFTDMAGIPSDIILFETEPWTKIG